MQIGADLPSLRDLYDTDFYAWTRAQAESLRRLADQPVGAALGAGRLAREIEELGEEQRRSAHAALRELLAWMLMVDLCSIVEYRPGWLREIARARTEFARRATPSLLREIGDYLRPIYAEAAELAKRRLELRGDMSAAARPPLRCPWTISEIIAA